MPLADYQTLVDSMVRAPDGVGVIATSDRDRAIESARLRYSMDCDRQLVEDVIWTADGYFGPLPDGWTEGSWLVQAEFPIGEQPISILQMAVYQDPTALMLASENALQAGDTVRVTYAAQHVLRGGATPADTIPLAHRQAVASFAAHLLCAQLAAHFSGQRETSLNADHAEGSTPSRSFAALAKEYRAAYFEGIGKADPRADKGAGGSQAATGEPAASVSAWQGRTRNSLTRGNLA